MSKWPTLEGRLSQPLTSEGEALEQLSKTMELTAVGKKKLKRFRRGLRDTAIEKGYPMV